MSYRETEHNYAKALALARTVVEQHLTAHIQVSGGERDESVEDLAQSIVGTESVVRLIMTVPFAESLYEPVLVEAADEVGRAFFPDVYKRFVSSLESLPEGSVVEALPEEIEPTGPDTASIAQSLPDDLREYLQALTDRAGVEYLTSHLWLETTPDALIGRLTRLRRHFPDGDIGPVTATPSEEELSREQIVEVTKGVAAGLSIAFPWGFFARQTHERIAVATRYLVEQELRRAPEDLLGEGILPLVAHGLGPALRRCGGSANRVLALAFPERIRPWMDSHVPPGYWDEPENRRAAIRWLVEGKLSLRQRDVAEAVHEGRITKREFSEAGLTWLIKNLYRWSVAEALAEAYPALKPWERTRQLPTSFWEGDEGRERAASAVGWALGRAGLGPEKMRVQSAAQEIRAALRPWRLTAAFAVGFDGDAVAALQAVFPGAYEPWEISHMPREAWNDPSLRDAAMRWLLDRLGIVPAEIPQAVAQGRLTPDTFKEAGLDGLLRVTGSVWRAVGDVFPGRFQRWELGTVPRSHWRSRAHVREAVHWALERLAIWPGAVASATRDGRLSANELVRLGLGSLVMGVFRGDVAALCQVGDVLPSERYVPLSRYYRQTVWQDDGRPVSWRLRSDRRAARRALLDSGSELDRHVSASRSVREERRRRSREPGA